MTLNPWLAGALALLAIWLAVFWLRPAVRKEMLHVSLWTMLLGLTEPFFVPEYWNPPSLFDLAAKTGFDIESFIFAFSLGGLAAVLYEALFPMRHQKRAAFATKSRRMLHRLALASPFLLFVMIIGLSFNPIYAAIIALFAGSFFAVLCRPDLLRKMLVGGFLFLSLYFIFFLAFNAINPAFVQDVWNFPSISGILILGIPLEELLFAFSVGLLWSGIYEHAHFYRVVRMKRQKK